jgi:predicted 2-oxoglutarate/Fe(II)-dependent dioxygenase YbiX
MNPVDSVLLQRNAIRADDLAFLIDYSRRAPMVDSLVSNFEDEVPDETVEWVVNKKIRDTQEVQLTDAVTARMQSVVNASVLEFINSFYDLEVLDIEPLHILHYGIGGHYSAHVDAETLYTDEIGLELWEKTLNRDLSIVYFLNDDFSGGELVFPNFDLVIKPEAGTLVCFPSDHHFIHGVNPVTAGDRYTLVTWMTVKGTPTLQEINQESLDRYHREYPKRIEQKSRIKKASGLRPDAPQS